MVRRGVALAVVLVAAGSPASASGLGRPVPVSAPDLTVAEFSAATGPTNPRLMVASAMDSDTPATNTHCAVYVSRDGAGSWSEVPAWPQEQGFTAAVDPWVDIGVDGVIHATCIGRTPKGSRVLYIQSRDLGQSWSAPSEVTPIEGGFHRNSSDKDALAVGIDGTVYVCFNQIVDAQRFQRALVVSRSVDEGRTWTSRDTGAGGFCNGVSVAPDGAITVVFVDDLGRNATVTSLDGGQTWMEPVVLGDIAFTNFQLPAIVREGSGRTIVAAVAGPLEPHLQISVEDAAGQLIGQRDLDPPSSDACTIGRLIQPALTAEPSQPAVLQIGCKIDPTRDQPGRLEVWLYPNVGQPGSSPIKVIGFQLPPVGNPTPFAQRFPDGGDYWDLTWMPRGVVSMWVDPRTGGGPGVLMSERVPLG